jgi:hypothetical protein
VMKAGLEMIAQSNNVLITVMKTDYVNLLIMNVFVILDGQVKTVPY